MKKLILAMIALTSLSVSATSLKTHLSADILKHDFDANSPLAELEIVSSRVDIDFSNDLISLSFVLPWSCPVDAFCATLMPMRSFEVEYLTFETDECNVTTFVAENDNRPVDGSYEKITVRDFSRMTCPHIMVFPFTNTSIEYEVKFYSRMSAEEVHFKHYFTADKLN